MFRGLLALLAAVLPRYLVFLVAAIQLQGVEMAATIIHRPQEPCFLAAAEVALTLQTLQAHQRIAQMVRLTDGAMAVVAELEVLAALALRMQQMARTPAETVEME